MHKKKRADKQQHHKRTLSVYSIQRHQLRFIDRSEFYSLLSHTHLRTHTFSNINLRFSAQMNKARAKQLDSVGHPK